jgi:hypothetical protein
MAIACDRVRELASGFVLGALEPDEMAAVRDHLDHCAEPHPELAELGGVVPYLAVTPELVEPPAWLRGSVIAAAKADLQARRRVGKPIERRAVEPAAATAAATASAVVPEAEVISLGAARRSRSGRAVTWITRMAAAVAVVALAGYAVHIQGDLDKAKQDQSHLAAVINVIGQPDTKWVPLFDNEGKGAGGIAALRPNGHIVVNLDHLSATKGDEIYVVWLTGDHGAVAKVGSFTVGDDGQGFLEVDNVPTSASVWVTVCREPNSKVTKPTGPTILSGTISL